MALTEEMKMAITLAAQTAAQEVIDRHLTNCPVETRLELKLTRLALKTFVYGGVGGGALWGLVEGVKAYMRQ